MTTPNPFAPRAAHWVLRDLILWEPAAPTDRCVLVYDPAAALQHSAATLSGGTQIELAHAPVPPEVRQRHPHLSQLSGYALPPLDAEQRQAILRSQIALARFDASGKLVGLAQPQIAGVLDDCFHYSGDLGVSFVDGTPILRVWAPTARKVELLRYADSATAEAITTPMEYDPSSGVWSVRGAAAWYGQFYRYAVEVYAHCAGAIVTNHVTDPYSISLAANSTHSQIIDLGDPQWMPSGWADLAKPDLAHPTDIVLYELHIRDFSIGDSSVPAALRGTYRAFTLAQSAGIDHLRSLAQAGISHVHLLPSFDIASIEEIRARQAVLPWAELTALPPDSAEQQALLHPLRARDGFNWGYDPYHYSTPEGSYSSDPDGPQRILEFREMVQALNRMGLRVVMDVVYNHTHAAGQSDTSVLDRIVPGYYHRYDASGKLQNSTCCANTASEHRMMGKLLSDSIRLWATAYKIDGFRFDLMGHHMRQNMVELREMLDNLSPACDGVDGKAIYVYGEGWDFGEVAHNGRGVNASQINMAGTGIGSFNDRIRDALRGGAPFEGLHEQGFATGLLFAPNAAEQRDWANQHAALLELSDLLRVNLVGNLRDYQLTDRFGQRVRGSEVRYRGSALGGYNAQPSEHIAYVSAHDNETLFDGIQLKAAASVPLSERVRMHNLAHSVVLLSQGIPFIHAGDELLRSKSLDRNSFNSSDWFNRIDWSGQQSTWGSGLPPADDNRTHWAVMAALLADPALKPTPELIRAAADHVRELLQVRRSSPLFRLRDLAAIQRCVQFTNVGPQQIAGVIALELHDVDGIDPRWQRIVVIFNAAPETIALHHAAWASHNLGLHPVLATSADERARAVRFEHIGGTISVPGRTTAVLVEARG